MFVTEKGIASQKHLRKNICGSQRRKNIHFTLQKN